LHNTSIARMDPVQVALYSTRMEKLVECPAA
jgi:hypothetical protein